MPYRREEKDPLDTILKGLNIAANIYGIKEAGEKSAALADQQKRAATEFQQSQSDRDNYSNPTSPVSMGLREQFAAKGIPMSDKVSALDITKIYGHPTEVLKNREVDPVAREMQLARLVEMKSKNEEAQRLRNDPQAKLSKLSAEQKARFDNAKMALIGVNDMAAALANGANTFSLVGDNEFTRARGQYEEGIGRMQSGGAIQKQEEARFRGFVPKMMDQSSMQSTKLKTAQAEMLSRLKTLGFTPDEVGVQMYDIKGGGQAQANSDKNSFAPDFMTPNVQASGDPFAQTKSVVQQELIRRKGPGAVLPGKK